MTKKERKKEKALLARCLIDSYSKIIPSLNLKKRYTQLEKNKKKN